MEQYLKSLNPVDEKLIYGQKYSLYRGKEYLGIAVWTKDDNVGDSFQNKDHRGVSQVYIPDRWEILN